MSLSSRINTILPFPNASANEVSTSSSDIFTSFTQSSNQYSDNNLLVNLNHPINIENVLKERDELLKCRDTLIKISTKKTEEGEQEHVLHIHGVSNEHIKEIQDINDSVEKGRALLSKYLIEYHESEQKINDIDKEIHKIKETIHSVKYSLICLEDTHISFKTLSTEFIDRISKKEMDYLEELQSEQGLLVIKKDKLETLIKTLSSTYKILKNSQVGHICPICIQNEVDCYIDPCGHTLCHKCCSKLSYCHMCRTRIKMTRSIFYS
jgi:hypothetical protein